MKAEGLDNNPREAVLGLVSNLINLALRGVKTNALEYGP